MALSVDYQYRGVTIQSAYVRVDSFIGGKRQGRVTPEMAGEPRIVGEIGVYASALESIPVVELTVAVDLVVEETPYETLYAHLKTLPEFAGAIDC